MPPVILHPTWVRDDDISDLWLPAPGATEYLLCSCWTTVAAWSPLIGALRAHAARTPGFKAEMYFDLACTEPQLWNVWADFLASRPRWCAIYVVEGSPLFHVKAVAARGRDGTKVIIGSANLTRAGQGKNFEAMAEVRDDEELYHQLAAALRELHYRGRAHPLRTPEDVAHLADRAASKRQAVAHLPDVRVQTVSSEFDGDAAWAASLFNRGVYLYRSEAELELTVSVTMDSYRKAGILRPLRSDELAAGITWGDRSDGMSISLVPAELEKQCRETRMRCGKILARLALPVTGRLWLPAEWSSSFLSRWRQAALPASDPKEAICEHVGKLKRLIDGGELLASRRQELEQIIDVLPPRAWNIAPLKDADKLPSVIETLHLETAAVGAALRADPRPSVVDADLRDDVIRGVMAYINRMTGSRLTVEYPLVQVQALQSPPTLAPVLVQGPAELIHMMAEWTRIATAPHLRLTHARAPTNAVGAALYAALRDHVERSASPEAAPEPDAAPYARIYGEALRWQSQLANLSRPSGPTAHEQTLSLMNQAAAAFRRWFQTLRWGEPPSAGADGEEVEARDLSLFGPST